MVHLTPTVHERLAQCATSIRFSGLVTGALVEVDVAGIAHTFTASGGTDYLTVPPLNASDVVRARQNAGSGYTPFSPAVIVEDAAVPPTAGPLLPSQVGDCGQCVRVDGLVPGCEIELRQVATLAGSGTANRHGWSCVPVSLRRGEGTTSTLRGRMRVCGAPGPEAATPIVSDKSLPKPVVGEPLFGCQRVVPLSGLHLGAKTRIETELGTFLGWICNCGRGANVNVLHPLLVGDRVRAQQYWDGDGCKDDGPYSDWRLVIPPDERIKPTIEAPLVEGDDVLRVTNQIVGADLTILLRDGPEELETRFGPRPASEEVEIGLNSPLFAAQQVAVEQHLCGRVEVSDWVTVLPAPPVVLVPIILPPLHACGGAVQVSGLHPGALVRIFQDGTPAGLAWTGLASSVSVATNLAAGTDVTARQWVGGTAGPESDPVTVQSDTRLHEPRIVEPVAFGDTEVVVSGVTPGALVSIYSGTTLLGERYAAESLVRVGVTPIANYVLPTARLCGQTLNGDRVFPITAPHATGPEAAVGERDVDYGTVSIPTHTAPSGSIDGGFDSPVRGRLYFPADSSGEIASEAKSRPLVVIAHGMWNNDEQDESHLGYAWLAHHLARWGMFVLSIDLSKVNQQTNGGPTHQTARAELMLRAAERAVADSALAGRLNRHRVALVGHSMSGEGVLVAKVFDADHPDVTVRSIVSLAPVNYRPDLFLEHCHYLQLHGSFDYLLNGWGVITHFHGHRLFDRAWRTRTHAWVEGGRHQGWNPNWWYSPQGEGSWDVVEGSLYPDDHAVIGRTLVNAFFQDTLFFHHEYRGYLEGLVEAEALRPYTVQPQHHGTSAEIVDDMGDEDRALGLATESPIDRTENRQGGVVNTVGPPGAIDVWEDLSQASIVYCSQGTRATDLAWSDRNIAYRSELPTLAASPTGEIALRIAVRFDTGPGGTPDETWNMVGLDMDLFVELESSSGTATIRLGASSTIPYPLPGVSALAVPRTIRLPMDAFTAVNPAFDLGSIMALTLRPAGGATGRILIDDIEVAL